MRDAVTRGDSGGEGAGALLEMRGIGMAFSGVRVLDNVDFDLVAGEVHALTGENGAGKTTLIKILSGAYSDHEGEMLLSGRRVRLRSPHEAFRNGIAAIHQELSLVPGLSVLDNIFLGREQVRGGVWLDRGAQRRRARRVLDRLGLDIALDREAGEFPVSVRQMIEIAKALAFESRIVVMDEPTATLSAPESARLFEVIGELRAAGCGVVFISHRMEEIYRIADRVTVLRDGARVGSARLADLPEAGLLRLLVGREVGAQFPPRPGRPGEPRLVVERFSVPDPSGARRLAAEDVSFTARAGEVLGLAGLRGAGTSEVFHGLFGAYGDVTGGRVRLRGQAYRPRSPSHAMRRGIALLTNDRKGDGLVPGMSVAHNVTLAALPRFSPGGWLRGAGERAAAESRRAELGIRLASVEQDVMSLSGGNQQKTVIAKWLETRPDVLLLDEPTRGVDVGAKRDIYALLAGWTAAGATVLLITSELPELLALSDRILVFHRGRLCAELAGQAATPEAVMRAAMGGGAVPARPLPLGRPDSSP